jgi:hypothetical protein
MKYGLLVVFCFVVLIQPLTGQTWTSAKRLTWTANSSFDPKVTADTNNNIHIVWQENMGSGEIFYKKSTDGGASWITKRLTWNPGASYSPVIVTDSNDNIHVTWYEDYLNVEIFYKKSTNGGTTWTQKQLTWAGGSYNPDIAVDSNNHIHIVWEGGMSGNFEIYYKKSVDGGSSWTQKRLTWNSGISQNSAIAVDKNDNIHIVWHDYTPGYYALFYKKSTNGGASWTTKRLTWTSSSALEPAIATDSNNNIHIIWRSDPSGNYEIFYKMSTNGGTSWKTKRLTWSSENSYSPVIAADWTNNVHVAWMEERSGNREIFYKRSTDGGVSWEHKRLTWTSGESSWPDIAMDPNNKIHVVYYDNTVGNREIYHKIGIQY